MMETLPWITSNLTLCYVIYVCALKPDTSQLSSKTFLSQRSKTTAILDPDLSEQAFGNQPTFLKAQEQETESSVNPWHKKVVKYPRWIRFQ